MGVNEILKEHDKNFQKLCEEDKIAKENNQLVGRYIREPFADGYAYYKIVKENKKTVRIKVVTGIGDDWVIPYWGESATVNKDYIIDKIGYQDKLAELFSQAKR